ncbi:hypothetical protein [Dyella sedimenti]|uniref:hypothetical protein n=1 Tax=Dyella sedimenti TaxID=2919947 RepID=UPI001FAA3938|nr:hypothetical protein [Dyella sedimenti]
MRFHLSFSKVISLTSCMSIIMLCGALMACHHDAGYLPLSKDCKAYLDMRDVYLDKLEASGRFSADKMACFRQHQAATRTVFHDPSTRHGHSEQEIDNTCRAGQKIMQIGIRRADGIAHLSKEAFDAEWGRAECTPISPPQR